MLRLDVNRRARAVLMGAGLVLALAACGSDKSETELAKATAGFLKDAGQKIGSKIKPGKAKKTAGPAAAADPNVIVAKALAATKGPIAIVVRVETNSVLAMNPVGRNGNNVTWGSATGQGITYNRGVLTNTRGLGEDLMSSSIESAVSAITARRNASYTRDHYYLGDLGQNTRLTVNCTLARTKSERVAVGDINADAAVMKESCSNGAISFTNLYWVDGRGNVLKSSQWVGQRIGSLAIQNLRL